ncbi:MAG: hypothetical protein ABR920_11315 [Terriglobales bacterium]
MAKVRNRSHKHFQLDSVKIKRAQKALRAKTETETIERALDLAIAEHESNRLALEANDDCAPDCLPRLDLGSLPECLPPNLRRTGGGARLSTGAM